MLNSNSTNAEDLRIYQIIDANLDRAREGLRVLEDWARFGLGKEKYVKKIKNFEIKIFRLCSGVKGMSGKEQDEILNLIKKGSLK